ncbi:hypothetical protein PENTCL1PPCAC_19987, partial [Pristionchus entomophagus]
EARSMSPRWIVHLISISPSSSSSFSMAIGDEDYSLVHSDGTEYDACGVGLDKVYVVIVSTVSSLKITVPSTHANQFHLRLVSSTSLALRNGELAGRAAILSIHQDASNHTIRVRTWSNETRKLTQITISPDLVVQSIGKQLLRDQVGSVIAAGDGPLLARFCDQNSSCKTLLRGTK